MTAREFTQRMIVLALLAIIAVVGVLSGYNPFEVYLAKDETRAPGTWKSAPLATPNKSANIEDAHLRTQSFPETQPREIELE